MALGLCSVYGGGHLPNYLKRSIRQPKAHVLIIGNKISTGARILTHRTLYSIVLVFHTKIENTILVNYWVPGHPNLWVLQNPLLRSTAGKQGDIHTYSFTKDYKTSPNTALLDGSTIFLPIPVAYQLDTEQMDQDI